MNTPADFLPMPAWLEQAWLERYLDRDLSGREQAWFEAYVLDKPALLERIEADSALRALVHADADAFAPMEAAAESEPEPEPGSASVHAFPRSGRSRRRPPLAHWPMAACFVLGLGIGGVLLHSLSSPAGGPAPLAAPSRLVFDSLRGSYTGARVDAGDPAAPLMIVDVALPIGSRIESAQAEHAGQRLALPPAPISAEGFATWTVPAPWRGEARLLLDLRGADGASERIELEL